MADQKYNTILTPVARLAFPSIATPKEGLDKTKPPKYEICLIFDESAQQDERFNKLKEAARSAAQAKWNPIPKTIKSPFRDGSDRENYAGFGPGTAFFNCSSKYPPKLLGPNLEEVKPDAFYPGCYVVAKVHPYAYDGKMNKGIAWALWAIQKIKDGERLDVGERTGDGADNGDDFRPVDPSAAPAQTDPRSVGEEDLPFDQEGAAA